tara:strand:+ start:267 stop:686 length:420 start_codon:yes stop_codon:yes gene_type:complete
MDKFPVNKAHYDTIVSIMTNLLFEKRYKCKTTIYMSGKSSIGVFISYKRDQRPWKEPIFKLILSTWAWEKLYNIDPSGDKKRTLEQVNEVMNYAQSCEKINLVLESDYIAIGDKTRSILLYALQHLFDPYDTGLTKRAK